jgi:hypothetical protein
MKRREHLGRNDVCCAAASDDPSGTSPRAWITILHSFSTHADATAYIALLPIILKIERQVQLHYELNDCAVSHSRR